MTLNDFLSRVDIEKDGDKTLLWCEYINTKDGEILGWSNLEIEKTDSDIRLLPDINNSPFTSDNNAQDIGHHFICDHCGDMFDVKEKIKVFKDEEICRECYENLEFS